MCTSIQSFINSQLTIHDIIWQIFSHADLVLAGCTNGDIRLVDGKNKHEGRVEMCVDGIWGAISAYSLTFQAARVICEQLGYPSECEHLKGCHRFYYLSLLVLYYRDNTSYFIIF